MSGLAAAMRGMVEAKASVSSLSVPRRHVAEERAKSFRHRQMRDDGVAQPSTAGPRVPPRTFFDQLMIALP